MAQQERAVRTRRAVLEAAAAVFAERGYAAATIGEILARAQVTKGALYFHFDSKAALAQGDTIVLLPGFTASSYIAAASGHRATTLTSVPLANMASHRAAVNVASPQRVGG